MTCQPSDEATSEHMERASKLEVVVEQLHCEKAALADQAAGTQAELRAVGERLPAVEASVGEKSAQLEALQAAAEEEKEQGGTMLPGTVCLAPIDASPLFAAYVLAGGATTS